MKKKMNSITGFTRGQLRKHIGCPGFVVDYLNDCGRLPIVKESKGRGYPTRYHPDSIEIIKRHLAKNNHQS